MKETILLKIGGRPASNKDTLQSLLEEMSLLQEKFKFILVHGGGNQVSELSKALGIEPQFQHGIRQTSEKETEIVDMVLAGSFNKYIVRMANVSGLKAVGISGYDGPTLLGEPIENNNRTGSILECDADLIKLLIKKNYFCVIAPPCSDQNGEPLNINADESALAIAQAMHVDQLIFLSDIPGIMNQGEVLKKMNKPQIESAIDKQIITGGMIPKVRSSLRGLEHGIGQVVIGGFNTNGDLLNLINGETGSHISLK